MTKPLSPTHNSIYTPRQPWISSPYSLISWWDMEQFSAEEFYAIGEDLGRMAELFSGGDEISLVSEINQRGDLQFRIERILDLCRTLDLKVSVACANEFLEKIEGEDFTTGGTQRLFQELSNTIRREMQTVLFFHVPSAQAEFYDKKELFGTKVSGRFPNLRNQGTSIQKLAHSRIKRSVSEPLQCQTSVA
jgi:hypothetical protein